MPLLISYDLEDNYLRQKTAEYIIDAGFARVQYSVYIGTIADTATQRVIDWLQALAQHKSWGKQDSLLILSLTRLQVQEILVIGTPKWDKDDLSDDRHTLVL